MVETQPAGYFQEEYARHRGRATRRQRGRRRLHGRRARQGSVGINYNFGELKPSTLSGFVYFDIFHNGVLDLNDYGIANVTVDLSGTNDLGQSIAMDDGHQRRRLLRIHRPAPGHLLQHRADPAEGLPHAATTSAARADRDRQLVREHRARRLHRRRELQLRGIAAAHCRLRDLAIHVGNTFFHFQQTYQRDPEAFARTYPNLVDSIAAGEVPWGTAAVPEGRYGHPLGPEAGDQADPDLPVNGFKARPLLQAPRGLVRARARARWAC